ncbi:MAG: hypothetical protein GX781_09950 [Clostridiales bacterium]|nr:hypothetical protein [Clostridiales bacterium]
MQHKLLILNFNNACASTLAKKLRAERIDCHIVPGDTPYEELVKDKLLGLILAGGISGEIPSGIDARLLSAGIPILCMGDTALSAAQLLGCELSAKQQLREVVTVTFSPSPLTNDLSQSERYISTIRHIELSESLSAIAAARDQVMGFAHDQLPIYGFSFQLESNDPDGVSILLSFAQDVCNCAESFSEGDFINAKRAEIEEISHEGQALCVITGSLESGVTAMLAHRALGDRLHCLMIDTCFMRENEMEDLLYYYRETLGMNVQVLDAKDRFCEALSGIKDQQQKYETITNLYARLQSEAAKEISHHMVIQPLSAGDLLLKSDCFPMPQLETEKPVIRPLRELFKEEIRNIGESLNMPQEMYLAQPFPGTGLALRIIGEVTRQKLAILRKADAIFREEIKKANLSKRLWKYFVTLRPINDLAAETDLTITIRAITLMTSAGEVRVTPARLPYDLVDQYAARILQALPEVRQIVNDITPGSSKLE